ncbi:SEC-C metal-binding domain-containing protein [Magnetococcales bacterium HHB-1]
MSSIYPAPVSSLLTYGDCRKIDFNKAHPKGWPDYINELGINEDHIPDLIRMINDKDLHNRYSYDIAVWAPIHAWRTLGMLQATEAINDLVALLDEDSDWSLEEIPFVLGKIGEAAINPLASCLAERENGLWHRIAALRGLEDIATEYPENRDQIIQILVLELKKFRQHQLTLNGFIIDTLATLKAKDALQLIKQAYDEDKVDLSVMEDFEDYQIEVGLLKKRRKPSPQYRIRWTAPKDDKLPTSASDTQTYMRETPKVGRNDPCPCGSGRKFKKCCLN